MSRYTGPKNKLARKVGEDLGLKTNGLKVAKRIGLRPGMHGKKMQRKLSDYGTQLKEKQKLRYVYGVNEKQLRSLYAIATKTPSATGAALLRGKGRLVTLYPTEVLKTGQLDALGLKEISLETLKKVKAVSRTAKKVKIVTAGDVKNSHVIKGVQLSKSAQTLIEKAGGKVEK